MRKAIIGEDLFPEIVNRYNTGGKTAAYDFLRSQYGIKHPYFVMNRIRECGKYTYDPEADQFFGAGADSGDSVFMDLDELCGSSLVKAESPTLSVADSRPSAMEKLIHELISDRLLTLSRYITLDSSTRTILIDQTSLTADGYQIVTH